MSRINAVIFIFLQLTFALQNHVTSLGLGLVKAWRATSRVVVRRPTICVARSSEYQLCSIGERKTGTPDSYHRGAFLVRCARSIHSEIHLRSKS